MFQAPDGPTTPRVLTCDGYVVPLVLCRPYIVAPGDVGCSCVFCCSCKVDGGLTLPGSDGRTYR